MPCRIHVLVAVSLLFCLPAADAARRNDGVVTVDDGTKLYYVEKGNGHDVLVAPVALYLEPYLLDDLAVERRVIFYDPRNRGRSDYADLATVSLDRQVADLEALRKALHIERMALLGWSGLGMEMAAYTLRHPERVTRLIQLSPVPPAASIMNASGDTRDEKVDQEALEALDAQAGSGVFDTVPQTYCRLRNALTNPANFVNPALSSRLPDVCLYSNEWPAKLWPYFGALLGSFGDYDWRPGLASLDVPRLVIHGREDGVPLAGAIAWAAGYDNARLMVLSPSGHFPFIEQHTATVAAIRTFLDGDWPEGAERVPPP